MLEEIHFLNTRAVLLDQSGDLERLAADIVEFRPRLIVLDPLRNLHDGDEDKSMVVAPLLRKARWLSTLCGSAVLLAHHDRNNNGLQLVASGGASDDQQLRDVLAECTDGLTRKESREKTELSERRVKASILRLKRGPEPEVEEDKGLRPNRLKLRKFDPQL